MGSWGLGPLGEVSGRLHAQRRAGTHGGRGDRETQPARLDYDWDATKRTSPQHQWFYGAAALWVQVPLAGTYTTGTQQQSTLISAWYLLPKPDDGVLVVVTAAGKIAEQPSVLHGYTPRADCECSNTPCRDPERWYPPAVQCQRHHGEQPKAWRNLRFARARCPPMPSGRVMAEDLSLTPEDWIADDPAAVPVLLTAEYRGLQTLAGAAGLGGRFGAPVPAADAAPMAS